MPGPLDGIRVVDLVSQADRSSGEPERVRDTVADDATALVAGQAITAAPFAGEIDDLRAKPIPG